MINSVLLWGWNRVAGAASVPPGSLVVFRWIFGFYLLLFDARHFAWVERAPDGLFNPPLLSLPFLVGGFPPAPFLTVLDVVGVVAICLMTVGYRTRVSTIVALVTLVASSSFGYSFGKISHQIALSAVLLCMAITDWGEAGERRAEGVTTPAKEMRRSRRVDQGMALLAVILAFGFLTAGFDKVRYWVNTDVSSSGILSWYYPRMSQYGESHLLAGLLPGVPPILLKLGDVGAALVEVSGFVALLAGRVPWRAWLLVVTTLHLGNAMVLNISFTTQVMVYLAFVTLTGLALPQLSRLKVPASVAVGIVGLWHVWTRLDGRGSNYFLWDGSRSTYAYDLYVCAAICLVVIGLLANDMRKMVLLGRERPVEAEPASVR